MSFFNKLFGKKEKESLDQGLQKTKEGFFSKITKAIAGKSSVDEEVLDSLEEALVGADVGLETTIQIIERIEQRVAKDKYLNTGELNKILQEEIEAILIAVDQLTIWSERAGVPIVKQDMGSDPAAVAFDTVQSAVARQTDIVLIDTAGRLHNKAHLMEELSKIKRVIQKVIPDAPHEVMLILDGSTGQNAIEQAKQFTATTDVSAIAITKLDGTAKGGVVLAIANQFNIPVKFIGVGEKMEDLLVFDKHEFVDSLFSLEKA